MSDLISRQAAIDIVSGYAEQFNGYVGSPNDSEVYAYARGLLLSIERNINALPSVQPEHGRWIEENCRPKSSLFCCSECHGTAYDIQPSRAKGWVKRCRYAYCPNCGAMMDEEG